jgi:DNA-binding NarL/FixJ family response regulator
MPRTCSPDQPLVRIVIADDRQRARHALRALLSTQAQCLVIGEAADGEQALDQVERLDPDLVILDVRMPRLDGIAAARQIKTRWPRVRVVVHSLAIERRDEALEAGADAFVGKGGAVADLLGAVAASCRPRSSTE